jgi:antitoxin FitA
MPSIQIRNVSAETHRILRRRAAEAGQSLQEYLSGVLKEQAARPTVGELFAEMATWSGGSVSPQQAADLVRADRDAR